MSKHFIALEYFFIKPKRNFGKPITVFKENKLMLEQI